MKFRGAYNSWRKGQAYGAKGEISHLTLPPKPLTSPSSVATFLPSKSAAPHGGDTLLSIIQPSGPVVFYFFREMMDRGSNYADLPVRPLSLMREGKDFIVMMDSQAATSSWEALRLQHPLMTEDQVIWSSEKELEDTDACHQKVFAEIGVAVRNAGFEAQNVKIVPYVVTPKFLGAIKNTGFLHFGDELQKSIDKSWLHSSNPSGIRAPRGVSCNNQDDLVLAFELLSGEGIQSMLFKPSFTQSGRGISQVKSLDDIYALKLEGFVADIGDCGGEYGYDDDTALFLLEEHIDVAEAFPSPVVQALGSVQLPVCDQVLNGMVHAGNTYPSAMPPSVTMAVAVAFSKLKEQLSDLNGFWGADYVIERTTLEPVLVDLNMARINGNHVPLIFASNLEQPPPHWECVKRTMPQKSPLTTISLFLKAGLILDRGTGFGIQFLNFIPGAKGRIFVGGRSQGHVQELVQQLDEQMAILETADR
jgi:hypothetical protein